MHMLRYLFVPILAKDGSIELHDIYINDVWHGSRRTRAQCQAYLNHVIK